MKRALFLLGFLFGVGTVALWASGLLWWTSRQRVTPQPSPTSEQQVTPKASPTPSQEEQAYQTYKDRLEIYGKRADDLERLLTLLLGGSTIYALAVGYNAYQQANDAKEKLNTLETETKKHTGKLLTDIQEQIKAIGDLAADAKSQITKLQADSAAETKDLAAGSKAQIERMESQIARNFPLFQDMDFALGTITYSILNLLPSLDLVDGNFQNLSERQIQQILFYEKAMSTFEFFNTEPLRREISGMFHGLGNFYALKFKANEGQRSGTNQPSAPQAHPEQEQDRERARFYLDYAIGKDRGNMAALNDRGYFALMIERPANTAAAAKDFLASLKADDDQQRARYNLALIEHREKNYQKSLDLIDLALTKTRWQKKPQPERIPDLLYNRACSLAGLAGTRTEPERKKLLNSAMDDLEKVAGAEKASWVELHKDLEKDLRTKAEGAEKDGDLIALLTEFPSRIAGVRQQLATKIKVA